MVMIEKAEMMEVLLEACPSFGPAWQGYLDEWDEGEDIPLYPALSLLARHLVDGLEHGETDTMPVVFAAIERLHVEGDQYVQEAATVGLLEDLQNDYLHTSTEPEQFRKYLGPISERWWDKLTRFWEHGEMLADE